MQRDRNIFAAAVFEHTAAFKKAQEMPNEGGFLKDYNLKEEGVIQ